MTFSDALKDNAFMCQVWDDVKQFFNKKEILITGGTGTLGKMLTHILLERCHPKGIRIYSRDELKQWQMQGKLNAEFPNAPVAFLVGDVRDAERTLRAAEGVDVIIHTAAMKQVPACESNPLEAVKTNVHGAENVITAALDAGCEAVMNVSTDKAVYPVNLYGATKLAAEKLFAHAGVYARGGDRTTFASCRYGNVLGSRGSVAHVFKAQAERGEDITVTHEDMTRFWITIPDVAWFLLWMTSRMRSLRPQVCIPKMPSMGIKKMAQAMAPGAVIKETGIRPGEKMHETLITIEESENVIEMDSFYISTQGKIEPRTGAAAGAVYGKHLSPFTYSSDKNRFWLDAAGLNAMLDNGGITW